MGMNGNEIEVGEGKPKVEGQGEVPCQQFIAAEVLLVQLKPKEKKNKGCAVTRPVASGILLRVIHDIRLKRKSSTYRYVPNLIKVNMNHFIGNMQ
jgi:hypothetical protein